MDDKEKQEQAEKNYEKEGVDKLSTQFVIKKIV